MNKASRLVINLLIILIRELNNNQNIKLCGKSMKLIPIRKKKELRKKNDFITYKLILLYKRFYGVMVST